MFHLPGLAGVSEISQALRASLAPRHFLEYLLSKVTGSLYGTAWLIPFFLTRLMTVTDLPDGTVAVVERIRLTDFRGYG